MHTGAASPRTRDRQAPAERIDPVLKAAEAGARAEPRSADTIVGNVHRQVPIDPRDLDRGLTGVRVLAERW